MVSKDDLNVLCGEYSTDPANSDWFYSFNLLSTEGLTGRYGEK